MIAIIGGCRSNACVHGIDTTRGDAGLLELAAAPTASCSSEPVAISVIAGGALPLETM